MQQDSISRGIILTLIPFAGYVIAFAFKYGYLSYFGLPIQFVTVNLETVLLAIAVLTISFLPLFWIYQIIVIMFSWIDRNNPIHRALWRVLAAIIIFLPTFTIFAQGSYLKRALVFFAVIALFVAGEFGWPLLSDRKQKTYREKMGAAQVRDDSIEDIPSIIMKTPARTLLFLLMFLFLLSFYADLAGTKTASSQKTFLSFEQDGYEYVLLQRNIAVSFDQDNKQIGKDFLLLSENKDSEVQVSELGPLKFK